MRREEKTFTELHGHESFYTRVATGKRCSSSRPGNKSTPLFACSIDRGKQMIKCLGQERLMLKSQFFFLKTEVVFVVLCLLLCRATFSEVGIVAEIADGL